MDKLKSPNKPVEISKWEILEAHRDVKRNQGAPGVDGQSIEDFEKDLKGNLYKIWNRMSSGPQGPGVLAKYPVRPLAPDHAASSEARVRTEGG
ncbi:hypothetical protein [Streptomyces sp. NRRL S-813]|uniref:hypothetical protein n=1 Tax=Streptomyces sp. NRRL S-813 TaxID=1463919 RepID=UPI001900377A|nr:hypothetical protein [Streptomyces sp. NRRL S-813]